MRFIDYTEFIEEAWKSYNSRLTVTNVTDLSAKVSTNHVFKIDLSNGKFVIAKLSYFGTYEDFVEDHTIINMLANNLLYPHEHFVARSLMKNNELFTFKGQMAGVDLWLIFYNPIRVQEKLPRILSEEHIKTLGKEAGSFHKACLEVKDELPETQKTMTGDIQVLLDYLETDEGRYEFRMYDDLIVKHANLFLENAAILGYKQMDKIPVFVDWNIGNFSIEPDGSFYSRWDYDWFRVGPRVLDFYFFSRVCSTIGDKTVFSYTIDPLLEDRFILFLKEYHKEYPLEKNDVLFIKEAYRFFLLNYVIRLGKYFFLETYAQKLQMETLEQYLTDIDARFDATKILKALSI